MRRLSLLLAHVVGCASMLQGQPADLIIHRAKIIAVDERFSIHEAMAVRDGRIIAVGTTMDVLAHRGPESTVVDLGGKVVLPGLIDSHVHSGAALSEFSHVVPNFEDIPQVLDYIRERAEVVPEGKWIQVGQSFITRLKEQRFPTREELDAAAPRHPVVYSTGPDARLNRLALERCGIDRNFKVTDGGSGHVEFDLDTGEPNGLLRGLGRLLKIERSGKSPSPAEARARTMELFRDYNANGLTTVCDRGATPEAIARYQSILDSGDLSVRIRCSYRLPAVPSIDVIERAIQTVSGHPLRRPNPWLRIIGTKCFLDGGMLTGSAYMLQPWGVSEMYGITDPEYRGVLKIPPDRLRQMVRQVAAAGLQFTAHAVGDGAVTLLVDVYDEVSRELPLRATRPCITHSNFMTAETIAKAARLGVCVDIQPAWLYLDTRTLEAQFGYERMRYFQPLRTLAAQGVIAGGGSDHMQKIGSLRSINPYNPFLGMWTAITRRPRWYEGTFHPEEALTREHALRFYTINNAHLLFMEDEIGSLEPGKRADFIVLDRDILTCPLNEVREIQTLATYVEGRKVFERG